MGIKKNKLGLFLIVFSTIIAPQACKLVPIAPDIITKISGNIYDTSNHEVYPQPFKIKVSEFERSNSGFLSPIVTTFIQTLDSTYTDSKGNYTLSFNTSGKGNDYQLVILFKGKLGISLKPKVGNKGINYPYAEGYYGMEIDSIGHDRHYDFLVYKSYYLKGRLILHDHPFSPINVNWQNSDPYFYSTGYGTYTLPAKRSIDTSVYFPYQRTYTNYEVYFTLYDTAGRFYYKTTVTPETLNFLKDTTDIGTFNMDPFNLNFFPPK